MQGGKSNTDVGEKKETPSGPKGNASKQKKKTPCDIWSRGSGVAEDSSVL